MISEYELPLVPSLGNYTVTTTIAGTSYIFGARWNTGGGNPVDAVWILDVYEIGQKPIVLGAPIVLGCYIGRRSNHKLFKQGVLVAHDLSGKKQEAGFGDLGVRVIVKYIPVLDLVRRLTELALR